MYDSRRGYIYSADEALKRVKHADECEACRVIMALEIRDRGLKSSETYWVLDKQEGKLFKHRLTGNCNANPRFMGDIQL